MSKPDGGSAFPIFPPRDHAAVATGMTLRDYFAAKAMQSGFIWEALINNPRNSGGSITPIEQVVEVAYKVADAMLAERGKP